MRYIARIAVICSIVCSGWLQPQPDTTRAATFPHGDDPPTACFAETNKCVSGAFFDYWTAHGGLAINGYPLTDPRREVLEDGNEYLVQYFERVRMELHPENPPPYNVLLGQFGREVFRESFQSNVYFYQAAVRPVAPAPGMAYFPETGHNVAPDFFAHWEAHGGLAQFGYPLAEEQDWHISPLNPPLRVQYFERGRLERHPENAPPYDILLGQFGRQVLAWRDAPLVAPFATLYRGDAALREYVGTPTPNIGTGLLDVIPFEHGLILIADAGATRPGYYYPTLLCGGRTPVNPRTLLPGGSFIVAPDEHLPAGGPGPQPGTYEPGGIIGLLWARGLRDCLGFATTATPSRQNVTAQQFSRGTMMALPERGEFYALYVRGEGDLGVNGYYQRYALP